MDEKQVATTNRVLKKLSAMRATLSDSELNVLDQIVIGATTDVAAHKMADRSADRSTGKILERSTTKIIFDAEAEVYKLVD